MRVGARLARAEQKRIDGAADLGIARRSDVADAPRRGLEAGEDASEVFALIKADEIRHAAVPGGIELRQGDVHAAAVRMQAVRGAGKFCARRDDEIVAAHLERLHGRLGARVVKRHMIDDVDVDAAAARGHDHTVIVLPVPPGVVRAAVEHEADVRLLPHGGLVIMPLDGEDEPENAEDERERGGVKHEDERMMSKYRLHRSVTPSTYQSRRSKSSVSEGFSPSGTRSRPSASVTGP